MKITKEQLSRIIKEEYAAVTNEGLHDEGLREMIADFVAQEVSGWHDVAKASLHKHIAENGFDISDIVMNSLGAEVNEGFFGGNDPADALGLLEDAKKILAASDGYEEAHDAVVAAIEAVVSPQGGLE